MLPRVVQPACKWFVSDVKKRRLGIQPADHIGGSVLGELARLAARGELEAQIARTYPLEQVRDAFRELERRHTHGKVVLRPGYPRPEHVENR